MNLDICRFEDDHKILNLGFKKYVMLSSCRIIGQYDQITSCHSGEYPAQIGSVKSGAEGLHTCAPVCAGGDEAAARQGLTLFRGCAGV